MRLMQNTDISGQILEPELPETLVCVYNGKAYRVSSADEGQAYQVSDAETGEALQTFQMDKFDWVTNSPMVKASLNGDENIIQYFSSTPSGYQVQYNGAVCDVKVFDEDEFTLSKYMLEKPEVDMSKWLTSPMPGMLVSVSVEEGDEVFPGQPLAVVEAMKMQNEL